MENLITKIQNLQYEYDEMKKEYDQKRLIKKEYFDVLKLKICCCIYSLTDFKKYENLGSIDDINSFISSYYSKNDYSIQGFQLSLCLKRNKRKLCFKILIEKDKITTNINVRYNQKDEEKIQLCKLSVILDLLINAKQQVLLDLVWNDYYKNEDKIECNMEFMEKYEKLKNELDELKFEKDFNDFTNLLKSRPYIRYVEKLSYCPLNINPKEFKILKDLDSNSNAYYIFSTSNIFEDKIKNVIDDKVSYEFCVVKDDILKLFKSYKQRELVLLDNIKNDISDRGVSFYKGTI